MLNAQKIKKLEQKANLIRQDVLKMIAQSGSGHPGGSLGMADIFTALYFEILKSKPKDPGWKDRDRLILSNGHICPVQYATLARRGYFSPEKLNTLRKLGSELQGHPHRGSLPGIENSSGPLGQGISLAVGMALAAKNDNKSHYVYCIHSDGEMDEGQTWEAYMSASKYDLHNLITIVDRNHIQIDGYTDDVMPLEPLKDKIEAFGWRVIEIDGHDFTEIIKAVNRTKSFYDKPTCILAYTVPGKGVSFMERKFEWHGKAPSKEELKKALQELQLPPVVPAQAGTEVKLPYVLFCVYSIK